AATLPGPPARVVIRTGDGALSVEEATLNTDTDAEPAPLTGAEVAALVTGAAMLEWQPPEGNG
ncbi:MAG TPA: hypothetical protein VK524_08685, partial [Polyangiaceae bacterium]|nr:hypothetical protein [Polyangiaceae bacterium]